MLYISGLTTVIRSSSCIFISKQWKCLPQCIWLSFHWTRIKIRQKMWWELLLSSYPLYSYLPPKKKTPKQKDRPTSIFSCVASVLRGHSVEVGRWTAETAAYLRDTVPSSDLGLLWSSEWGGALFSGGRFRVQVCRVEQSLLYFPFAMVWPPLSAQTIHYIT